MILHGRKRGLINNRGVTLIELLVVMVLSGIIVSMIFASYFFLQKLWIRTQIKEDIENSLVNSVNKLQKSFENSSEIVKTESNIWLLIDNPNDFDSLSSTKNLNNNYHILVYKDSAIFLDDISIALPCKVDSFNIQTGTTQDSVASKLIKYYLRVSKTKYPIEIECRVALKPRWFGKELNIKEQKNITTDKDINNRMEWDKK